MKKEVLAHLRDSHRIAPSNVKKKKSSHIFCSISLGKALIKLWKKPHKFFWENSKILKFLHCL